LHKLKTKNHLENRALGDVGPQIEKKIITFHDLIKFHSSEWQLVLPVPSMFIIDMRLFVSTWPIKMGINKVILAVKQEM